MKEFGKFNSSRLFKLKGALSSAISTLPLKDVKFPVLQILENNFFFSSKSIFFKRRSKDFQLLYTGIKNKKFFN